MPLEPTVQRLRRIMVLVPWVMASGDPTVEEVCARFDLTAEELAADIDLLMVCGLWPFTPGDLIEAAIEGGRVTIRVPQALDRPPRLTRAEAVALLVAGRAVADLPGIEESDSLRSALGKLARAIAPAEAEGASDLADRVSITLGTPGVEMVASLRSAVAERSRLRIAYWSAGRAEMTEREIDPLLVFGAGGAWYVAAVDHASDEERLFRVDRIREAERTGETFEPPAGFDASRYERGVLFTPSASDVECVIDLAPAAAWLREVVAVDEVTDLPDGGLRLRLRTPHLPWLVRLLLAAGPDATPVEPPALGEEVAAAARRALARYTS